MNFESSLEKEIRGSASNSSGSEGKGKRVGCSVGGSMVMNVEDRSEVVNLDLQVWKIGVFWSRDGRQSTPRSELRVVCKTQSRAMEIMRPSVKSLWRLITTATDNLATSISRPSPEPDYRRSMHSLLESKFHSGI